MQIPVQVTFHGLDHSAAVEERVHEKVAKLEQFCSDITSCRVTIEVHHRTAAVDHRKGEPYHISIFVTVPGDELVVKRDPKDASVNEEIAIALRDSFQAMERQVKDYVERRRESQQKAQVRG